MTDKGAYKFNEVYDRIKFATNVKTQQELASLLDIRQSSISDAKRRKSIPAEWLVKLHDRYGLSLDWLRFGTPPMYAAPEEGENDSAQDKPTHLAECSVAAKAVPDIGVYMTSVDYTDGNLHPDLPLHSRLVLPEQFLGEDRLVFFVDGKSMEPTLRKGAFVGVSTSQRNPVSGELYALFMPHEGVVFRRIIQDTESELFLLCFEQPGLPSTRLAGALLRDRMIGRLIWVLQEL